MKVVVSKVIWSVVALLSIAGLIWVWLIGLPIPDYFATNDEAPSKTYTVRIAPNTYFDVCMSENEQLTQTNHENLYNFVDASITTSSTPVRADLIDADKQIYGRPGSFCYRVFGDTIVTVNSKNSTYQGFQSLMDNEPYTMYGEPHKLRTVTGMPLDLPTYWSYRRLADKIHASSSYNDYKWDTNKQSLMWYGKRAGEFYKIETRYGLNSEIIEEILATTKACYKVEPQVAYTGENHFIIFSKGYLIGVRKVNVNTHLVVATNCVDQYEPAIATLLGKE